MDPRSDGDPQDEGTEAAPTAEDRPIGAATPTGEEDTEAMSASPAPAAGGGAAAAGREPVAEAPFRALPAGQTLGRYVVLGTLGKGGMGEVLEAFDRTLDRKVAVKVLHEELDDRHTARLLREAQALASLSHPNVVQVFEADQVGGQTFVVMERVEGQTLRQWMRSEPRPGWRACVEVFVQVGQGLAAAHEQGLVHRDFKPGNAIIDDKGRARVLDFGLARRVEVDTIDEGDLSSKTDDDQLRSITAPERSFGPPEDRGKDEPALDLTLTRTGVVLGTPAYMSPEQMQGQEADARSDQFSFCVSLWEAVYGGRPFQGRSMVGLIVSMAAGPARPAATGSKVPARLRQVLLRGLAVDPARRWPSMEALLGELRKLVAPRARRGLVLGLTLGLVGLGGVMAVPQYLAMQARCTGARAGLDGVWDDARRQQVEQAVLGTALSYAPGTWERIEPRLDDYAQAWVGKHTETCEATRVRGEQTEEVMELRMGCLHDRKVALRAAVTVLAAADDKAVEKAVALVEALPSLDRCDDAARLQQMRQRVSPPDPSVAQEVEALREQLADIKAELQADRIAAARELVEPVVQRAEALGYGPLLAEALVERAIARQRADELVEAEQDLERAFTLAADHGHDAVVVAAASQLVWVVGARQDRHELGLAWGKTALALSLGPGFERTDQAFALGHIGSVLTNQGKYPEALAHFQQALAIDEQVLGSDHTILAALLGNIGLVLWKQGKLSEALSHHERALGIFERGLGEDHPSVARSLHNVGNVLWNQGKLSEALVHYRRAKGILERALGSDHSSVATSLSSIGTVLGEQGKLEEALSHQQRALSILERVLGEDHPTVASTVGNIGSLLRRHGQVEEALTYQQRALGIFERVLGEDHPSVAATLLNIGIALQEQGRYAEAASHHQRALGIFERELGKDHPHLAYPLVGLAEVARAQGDLGAVRVHAERALAIREASEVTPDLLAEARFLLACGLWGDRAERARARALAEQAREAMAASGEGRSEDVADVDAWLAEHRVR